jgi:hypothetical protein
MPFRQLKPFFKMELGTAAEHEAYIDIVFEQLRDKVALV